MDDRARTWKNLKKKALRSLSHLRGELLDIFKEANLITFSTRMYQNDLLTRTTLSLAGSREYHLWYNDVMDEVHKSLERKKTVHELKESCDKLVDIFFELGGPFIDVAKEIKSDWDKLFSTEVLAITSNPDPQPVEKMVRSPSCNSLWSFNEDDFTECARYLKTNYKNSPDIPQDDPWLNDVVNMQYVPLIFKKPFNEENNDVSYDTLFPSQVGQSHILITGCPGSGKTVLLNKLSKDWAEGKCLTDITILLHVSLRRLMNKTNHPQLINIVGMCFDPTFMENIHKYTEAILRSHGEGVCFAFDGLDEYLHRNKKDDFVMQLINKKCLLLSSVIITCRPNACRYTYKKYPSAEIVGFEETQIKKYIENYYRFCTVANKSMANNPQHLLQYLYDHPKVMETCRVPLYLATIVQMYQVSDKPGLPSTETELYLYFVVHSIRRYLEREKNEEMQTFTSINDLEDVLSNEYKLFLDICHLAYLMKYDACSVISDGNLKDIYCFKREDRERMANNGLGILYSYSKKDGFGFMSHFSFQHIAIQEYLGAYYLSMNQLGKNPESYKETCKLINRVPLRDLGRFFFGIVQTTTHFTMCFDQILKFNHTKNGNDTLFLIQCLFEAQKGIQESCEKLFESRNSSLNISKVKLATTDCSAIGYVMCHCPNVIKELLMDLCELNVGSIEALQSYINDFKVDQFSNMQNIQMNYNPLSTEGLDKLSVGLLLHCQNVRSLGFSGCKLNSDAGKILSRVLSQLTMLQQLELYLNHLGDDGIAKMIECLKANKSLKILSFSHNKITNKGGLLLAEVIMTSPSLKEIRLFYNSLTDETRKAFFDATHHRSQKGLGEIRYAL